MRENGRAGLFRRRILVTGGAGFVGSHLCEQLLARGCEVVCVDNYSTGRKENIAGLLENPGFDLIEHDVTSPLHVEVDGIFNLACPASPTHYQLDPVQTTKVSVLGAINVLDLAESLNVPVVQASTSEVYGNPQEHPQRETYWGNVNPLGPRACYREGKRCAETLFFDYRRQRGVNTKIVRLFNTYGPRMHESDGRVISNLICQALQGRPLTIFGDGTQTRSFCYVGDLVDGLIRVLDTPAAVSGPINLGNPDEIAIKDLALRIIQLTASRSRIEHLPLPPEDPKVRRPDIALAKSCLDWRPRTVLDEGLGGTIAYFEHRIGCSNREQLSMLFASG